MMIKLKSIAGKEFYLNADLIYKIETNYDTIITLTDQTTIRVMESPEEIVEKVIHLKRQIYKRSWEMKE